MKFGKLIGVIDEGTTCVRFVIFEAGTDKVVCFHQIPIVCLSPKDGWCEQDPVEIYRAVVECIQVTVRRIERLGASATDIVAIGITNQRESTVVWDRRNGKPLYNVIMWCDNRAATTVKHLLASIPGDAKNKTIDYLRPQCGLPLSPYFSAVKLCWLRDNVQRVRKAMEDSSVFFGTLDTWLLYNLTGAEKTGVYMTDVTNASRTMLMNLEKLQWDPKLMKFFGISEYMLPEIHSSAEIFGRMSLDILRDVPITACIGNQHASMIGHQCFRRGQSKATFGTGCSILYNTGKSIVHSNHGLLTTVGYQLGRGTPVAYALEGSVATAGDSFCWLRDKMGIINTVNEIESMARMVPNTLDVYFVPAFSGLYSPYWNQAARGVICGITDETTNEHIVRATLEAVCFQARDIFGAIKKDFKADFSKLLCDGGMVNNALFLQLLADLTGTNIERTKTADATALGAALAAYKVVEPSFNIEAPLTKADSKTMYKPSISQNQRNTFYQKWKKAVEHSLDWDTSTLKEDNHNALEY